MCQATGDLVLAADDVAGEELRFERERQSAVDEPGRRGAVTATSTGSSQRLQKRLFSGTFGSRRTAFVRILVRDLRQLDGPEPSPLDAVCRVREDCVRLVVPGDVTVGLRTDGSAQGLGVARAIPQSSQYPSTISPPHRLPSGLSRSRFTVHLPRG